MLAKLTSKNQLTLPKAATQAVAELHGLPEYFDVQVEGGRIVLTPVRIQRADAVRAKLAELSISAQDIADALAWARGAGHAIQEPVKPWPVAAEKPVPRRKVAASGRKPTQSNAKRAAG